MNKKTVSFVFAGLDPNQLFTDVQKLIDSQPEGEVKTVWGCSAIGVPVQNKLMGGQIQMQTQIITTCLCFWLDTVENFNAFVKAQSLKQNLKLS